MNFALIVEFNYYHKLRLQLHLQILILKKLINKMDQLKQQGHIVQLLVLQVKFTISINSMNSIHWHLNQLLLYLKMVNFMMVLLVLFMDSLLIESHLKLVHLLLLMIQMLDQLSTFMHPSIKQDVYLLTYKDLKDQQKNTIIYKNKLNKDVYLMVQKKKILSHQLIMSL